PAPTQGEAFQATFQQVLDTCSALLCRVEHLVHENVAQRLEIFKLKARVKKLEQTDKVKPSKFRRLRKVGASRKVESSDDMEDVFNQGRLMNEDEGIELVKDVKIVESEGRQADKQAEIYNIDLDHSSKVLRMQEDDSEVQDVVEVVTTTKLMTEVVNVAASQEDQEIIKSINETPAQKATKRRKLSKEAQDLRKRLEVVEDEDDDVFVEATPLSQKVPVMDYQIVLIENKPRTMFEEPDGQDAIWRNQKSVHGLALVKRWKLLSLCGVHVITLSIVQLFLLVERRLQVEEESEMSLELLSILGFELTMRVAI
nr:hypothetical protein [Tanacetum cinerariifolium]